ncbi:electron transfer flavoprotein subunit alpha/FixB family protein [uncultured Dysosmobacter sp.]|uniref:electron transfer flavoprotein subunit alpha/FixB family protein n=1 Tax=uncultured Dysosmobacter sp. TaxID=2591384 RepID=UPI00261DA4AC|nr:electron transfer flavoprotein subunit alpha/FixB family protein [uncultured Dysosmobacter sp.]
MSIDIKLCKDVWVFIEIKDKKIENTSLELLGVGKMLAADLKQKLCAVVLGKDVTQYTSLLFSFGADVVYNCEHELLETYTTDAFTNVLDEIVKEKKPDIFLFGATNVGRDLAPRLAARLNTGLTADCTALSIDPESRLLQQTRPAFGGNIMATIINPTHRPQMATVRPGVMNKIDPKECYGIVENYPVKLPAENLRVQIKKIIKNISKNVNLVDADIIVSGGRGLGGPEGFELIQQLANALGGVVGASRAAVDSGWISNDHQVGQTGKTVKPMIYIACGISGAIQHQAGMTGSKCIIAINKNPDCSMMKIANYALCGDLYDIIPLMVKTIQEQNITK